MPAAVDRALDSLRLISAITPDTLDSLATIRGVAPDPEWDVYQLARALSAPEAVWRQVCACDRSTLIELYRSSAEGAPISPPLRAQPGFVSEREEAPDSLSPSVIDALAANQDQWSEQMEAVIAHPEPPESTPQAPTAPGSWEGAIPELIDTLGELQWLLERVAGGEVASKSATPEALAKSLVRTVPPSEQLVHAAHWAIKNRLCRRVGESWWLTPSGDAFGRLDDASKLVTLLGTWWASCPEPCLGVIRDSVGRHRDDIISQTAWQFPLIRQDEVRSWLDDGERLGVFSHGHATMLLTELARGELTADYIDRALPKRLETVYPDGVDGFVAPGPLTQSTRTALGLVAVAERRGMTPRFIVDPDTICRHLAETHSTQILDTLEPLIVGGVPTWLRRLIVDIEQQARSLRLDPSGVTTTLTCVAGDLAELLALDQKLSKLDITRESDTILRSPWPVETVRSVLSDAGYPTFPPVPRVTRQVAEEDPPVGVGSAWWGDRVAEASLEGGFSPWWDSLIRDAIRTKTTLSLCVDTGSTHQWMSVEPTSLAGGRLRIIDSASEVERTLPLKLIVAIDTTATADTPVT